MKNLKKLFVILCLFVVILFGYGFVCSKTASSSAEGRNYRTDMSIYEIDGHKYILAVTYDIFIVAPKLVLSSNIIHAESCPCKSKKE